jgi:hypothetical protein
MITPREQKMKGAIPLQHPATLAEFPAVPARKHSKPGTISLLTALGGLLLLIGLWVIAALFEDRFDDSVRYEVIWGRMTHREEFEFLLAIFGGLGVLLVFFAGLAIGILGAFQKERKRLLASLGIVINAILFLVIAIPWLLYLALGLLKPLAWH